MPLVQISNPGTETKILIWKITETFEDLISNLNLSENSENRIQSMKSEQHQKCFLAIRKLLESENYTDNDLFYDQTGKPYLKDKKHISISHSDQFATLVLSNTEVGVDIEKKYEKIIRIASKFVHHTELLYLKEENNIENIQLLTAIWSAKEAVFKIINQKGISFKNHIHVNKIDKDLKKTTAVVQLNEQNLWFAIDFIEIENYVLAFAIKQK
jgi:4'-phosphopantetheinyl transferase